MRRAALAAAALALLAPSAAVAQTPHVVASANGATARSSANEGEILSCGSGRPCTAAITAPARPPAKWDGEIPVSGRTVVDVAFDRPVDLLGAEVVDRTFKRVAAASVQGVDAQHWRVILPAAKLPDQAALALYETWSGDDERGHYTVSRTDFVGTVGPAALASVKQRTRGGGAVAQVDARTAGLIDARLTFGKKTLGQKSTNLAAPRDLSLSVRLSSGARRLLAKRRVLDAKLTLTVRPPSGDPVTLVHSIRLRAKPR